MNRCCSAQKSKVHTCQVDRGMPPPAEFGLPAWLSCARSEGRGNSWGGADRVRLEVRWLPPQHSPNVEGRRGTPWQAGRQAQALEPGADAESLVGRANKIKINQAI